MMQYHPEIINQPKIDDGLSPLQVAAQVDKCDLLCFLAATVGAPTFTFHTTKIN